MEKLRGVCIGAGYFSQFHFEAWNRIHGVSIVGIHDKIIEKAHQAANKFGIPKVYGDIEEMFKIEKPDFVDIISPPDTHLELCQLAMDNGIHIICQKPIAPTLAEAKKIAGAAEHSNVRMMVHENFRFMPWHREIKKLLNQKAIGDTLHSIHLRMRMGDGWQADAYMNRQPYFREMEQLLIYETGIHFIDVFRYLGGEIKQVFAKLKTLNKNIKGEDFAWVQVDFESGLLGFIDANRFNENTYHDPRLTFGHILLEGNEGSLRLFDDGTITVQPLGKKQVQHTYTFEKINFSGDCVYKTQEHFIECLRSGDTFESEIQQYMNNIVIQEAIYESSKTNSPIKIVHHDL